MSEVIPGVEVVVVDEPALGPGAPTDTSTAFLITSDANAPATPTLLTSPTQTRTDFPTATTMWGETDVIFKEGLTQFGAPKIYAQKLLSGTTGLQDTLDLLVKELGPGQVVAPPVVTADDIAIVAQWAFDTNRVYFANGPTGASDSALITIADAVADSGYGRNTALFADDAIIPGIGVATRTVPWSCVAAGLVARNDLNTGNPGLAAAGDQGICVYTLGVSAERSNAAMTSLNSHQINVARAPYSGPIRTYGWRTLANLTNQPHWWDMSGARVVMDIRANALAVSEHVLFAQIDGNGELISRWNGLLTKRLLELCRVNALFGPPNTAFTVDTGPNFNPIETIAQGILRAGIKVKTSPFAEQIDISLTRLPLA